MGARPPLIICQGGHGAPMLPTPMLHARTQHAHAHTHTHTTHTTHTHTTHTCTHTHTHSYHTHIHTTRECMSCREGVRRSCTTAWTSWWTKVVIIANVQTCSDGEAERKIVIPSTHTHTLTCSHMYTHTHTHTLTHRCTHTRTHTRTHTHTCTRTHTLTCSHTPHTHAHAHHTHTHVHTHTLFFLILGTGLVVSNKKYSVYLEFRISI